MEKSITNPAYYPRLTQYISESTRKLQDIPRAAKIEDMDSVTTKDGEVIDMKKLKTEMESAKTAIVSQSPLFAPYVHNFTPIYNNTFHSNPVFSTAFFGSAWRIINYQIQNTYKRA